MLVLNFTGEVGESIERHLFDEKGQIEKDLDTRWNGNLATLIILPMKV